MSDHKSAHPTIDSEQASQARCYGLPNDAPEGHYWSWVQSPKSIPAHYRRCMTCNRIDASEAIAQEANKARLDELELAVQQFIFNTKRNPNNFSEYATHRIKALTAEKGSNNEN